MTSQNVPQEMIDAYYEYTHLTLDRRKFVTKLREMVELEKGPRTLIAAVQRPGIQSLPHSKIPQ